MIAFLLKTKKALLLHFLLNCTGRFIVTGKIETAKKYNQVK